VQAAIGNDTLLPKIAESAGPQIPQTLEMPGAVERKATDLAELDLDRSALNDQDQPNEDAQAPRPLLENGVSRRWSERFLIFLLPEAPRPLENGVPRRWSERFFAATGVIFLALAFLPNGLKKGMTWYIVAHSLVLLCMAASIVCTFVGNTHPRMLLFLARQPDFAQVVIIALVDWLRVLLWPDAGWETTERISNTTTFITRLVFFTFDSLKGMSRWFRLFMSFLFFLGNFYNILSSYFMEPATTLFVVEATNTTFSSTTVKAGVATTMLSVTLSMFVIIWYDKNFQYSAMYRSHLPKLAVETAWMEPGSDEIQDRVEDREAAGAVWRGWLRKSEAAMLLSVVVFSFSVMMSSTALAHTDNGNESVLFIVLRVISLALGLTGAGFYFKNNVSWRRLKFTFLLSTEGRLWLFYTLVYTATGLVAPAEDSQFTSVLGTVYNACGFTLWLLFESTKMISRTMLITCTFGVAITLASFIYLTIYVWQDDSLLADLNGAGLRGVLTRYDLQRTCAFNLLVLMAMSLMNLSDHSYFILVSGTVSRRQILELEKLSDDPDGGNDTVVEHSLQWLLSQHSEILSRTSTDSTVS
jgi:hypothetical protein